jgi:integrase/recombinase XerD
MRRAYRLDIPHFMATLRIGTVDELRQADPRAVIALERHMRETQGPPRDNPPALGGAVIAP